ncbi:16S rRNA (guanine(966)-N(2))-methyltransferase RsmD [Lysobacter pythonis]|uniref:Ribosomal RNA small subunit methyltransferase D n=1 Tax=Solilutibacter pythonis TaxID=2483112 RepID=A0A3M2I2N0_9GAMM|nr:16S rRNA (guanine(966)-N(2))-methyltransferase RsmD [Lysobacter pythonis]RMH94413.1 16S rRNA (guanine(966)-N(2))-methyltransferase RsmD [Lysobacter pythonis]
MTKPRRSPIGHPPAAGRPGAVRIIGGQWCGSRLAVPDVDGLRPTSDRVRETLFNWLMPWLPGARVLDLFAGSGVLGLEAISRGAASATLVERDAALARALGEARARLPGAGVVEVVHGDALAWLRRAAGEGRRYDIAFVDPPFAGDLWQAALAGVGPLMDAVAMLYVEMPLALPPPVTPGGWRPHREGVTREVAYRLYRRGEGAATLPEMTPTARP